jgi:hypothetical protein
MSNFLNVSVLVLATMVLILAGMLGYLYWQQNKLMKVVASLHTYVQTLQQPVILSHDLEEPVPEDEDEDDSDLDSELDDEKTEEKVGETQEVQEITLEEPQTEVVTEDVDDLQSKTTAQLRELLNKKGIPYGKRDSKTVLLELLKASS